MHRYQSKFAPDNVVTYVTGDKEIRKAFIVYVIFASREGTAEYELQDMETADILFRCDDGLRFVKETWIEVMPPETSDGESNG